MVRTPTVPPQPPWVWGPSEVNAWIRAAYPSAGRPPRGRRRRVSPNVARLRIRLADAAIGAIREGIVDGLRAIGYEVHAERPHRIITRAKAREAVATIHHSMLWRGCVVSVRFEPPIKRGSSRHLLHRFAREFHVLAVSADET